MSGRSESAAERSARHLASHQTVVAMARRDLAECQRALAECQRALGEAVAHVRALGAAVEVLGLRLPPAAPTARPTAAPDAEALFGPQDTWD